MKRAAPRFWAHDEDDVVRRLYPIGGAAAVRDVLPHRTLDAIRIRASLLRVPARLCMAWNASTISRLIELRSRDPRLSDAEIATALGCTLSALQTAMSRRGLTHQRSAVSASVRALKLRACLCCRNNFHSTGAGNRMCPRCAAIAREAA